MISDEKFYEDLKTSYLRCGLPLESIPVGKPLWVYIDPLLAIEILERNLNIRSINKNGVKEYENEMKAGQWRVNGEPIVIDSNGKLRNGQHRLNAIVNSGVGIWCLVVYNVPADQCDIYDIQLKRSLKQIQGGDASSSALSLAARLICGIDAHKIATGIAVQYYNAHSEDLEKAVKLTRYASKRPVGNKTGCHIATYIWLKQGPYEEMLEKFFKILNSGLNIDGYESSAPLVLRRQLTSGVKNSCSSYAEFVTDITYSAIKDFISGTPRKKNYLENCNYKKSLECIL